MANRYNHDQQEYVDGGNCAIVSAVLEDSEITATLSGGAAVTIFSDNAYQSSDLDFVTSESNKIIEKAISKLGFQPSIPRQSR